MQRRVVIFEDDNSSRKLLTAVLEKQGYEVISAADPMLCPIYAKLGETCPHEDACGDFLLTDNRMPYMSGLDFVEAQSQRGCKGIIQCKAIISASWSTYDRSRAETLGCMTFDKPYSINKLTAWMLEQEKMIPADRKLVDLDAC